MLGSVFKVAAASFLVPFQATKMDDTAIWSLSIFIIVNVALVLVVGFPVSVSLWRTNIAVPISFAVPPVLGVAVMLCTRCISWHDVAVAIQGNKAMQPYGIVILFMSTAYMCTTLDITGVFAWLSLKFTYLSKGNGRLLFVSYFFLAGMITLVTSNDIVVMTLTPIVCHFASATGADPIPFLTAQFSAANLWSMALLVGNPTNVIVGQAAGVGFVTYMKWMAVPTIVTGCVCLSGLCMRFWHSIPARLNLPDIDPRMVLQDRISAIFGTLNILLCLVLLAASQYVGIQLWVVTLANATLAALFNTGVAIYRHWTNPPAFITEKLNPRPEVFVVQKDEYSTHLSITPAITDLEGSNQPLDLDLSDNHCTPPHTHLHPHHQPSQHTQPLTHEQPHQNTHQHIHQRTHQHAHQHTHHHTHQHADHPADQNTHDHHAHQHTHQHAHQHTHHHTHQHAHEDPFPQLEPHHPEPPTMDPPRTPFQTLILGFTSLPWDVPPFVMSMFILVQGLAVNGWTDRMGEMLARASPGVMPALLVNSFVAIVLANVINNQPMTILMTKVLLSPAFDKHVGDDTKTAALFGLVTGSNLGANFSLIGALAGIMWCKILSRQHVPMSYFKFVTLLAPFGVLSTVTMCSMLWLQFHIF